MSGLPVACELTPGELSRRRASILTALRETADAVEPLPDGLRLTFAGTDPALVVILDVIRLERACCRFLRFQLIAEAGRGPLALTITGPDGTRPFLETELGLGPSSGGDAPKLSRQEPA